jgi:hypothetical protein
MDTFITNIKNGHKAHFLKCKQEVTTKKSGGFTNHYYFFQTISSQTSYSKLVAGVGFEPTTFGL